MCEASKEARQSRRDEGGGLLRLHDSATKALPPQVLRDATYLRHHSSLNHSNSAYFGFEVLLQSWCQASRLAGEGPPAGAPSALDRLAALAEAGGAPSLAACVTRSPQPVTRSRARGRPGALHGRVHTSLAGRGLELCGLLALPSRRSVPLILGSVIVTVYNGFTFGAICCS